MFEAKYLAVYFILGFTLGFVVAPYAFVYTNKDKLVKKWCDIK